MSEAIAVALISGGLSLLGAILSGWISSRKQEQALKIAQAVTDTRLEELTRAVREHNALVRRMPVMEEQIKAVTGQLRELRHYQSPVN